MTTSIAFIDPRVANYRELARAIDASVEVLFLDANKDGVQQIADCLAGRSNVEAVHIVSHGAPASVQLGAAALSSYTLFAYERLLSKIGSALSNDADILLYGCSIARGPAGRAFVKQFGSLTGSNVAASDDPTGSSSLGGDAELEFRIGDVSTQQVLNRTDFDNLGVLLAFPPGSINPSTVSAAWIWTNPFGNLIQPDSISASGQIDYFRFVANKSGNHTISVSGAVDSELRIYDSSGAHLTDIIDNPTNPNATESVTLNLTEGNWYYIAVSGYNASTGSYNLSIDGPSPFINDITTDAPNYSGSFNGGSISPAGDIDWFKLVAPAGTSSLSLSVAAKSAGLNTIVQLLDASGNPALPAVIDNGGAGGTDSATASISANATYYVGVTSLQSGTYDFTADFNPDQSLPVLSIAALSADKPEGTNQTTAFTFQVTRSGGNTSGTSTVHWAVDFNQSPSANAADFSGGIVPSGNLTWGPNDTAPKTISVGVNGDQTYEGDLPEHFIVALSGQTGATLGTSTANGSIQNDDSPPQLPVLSIAALSADKPEGTNQTTAFTFQVTRSGGDTSGTSTVHWAVDFNQSPQANAADFSGGIIPSGNLTWGPDDTAPKTISVGVNGDQTYEGDLPEHFIVALSGQTGAKLGTSTANGSIQNDDLGNSVTAVVQGLDAQIGSTPIPPTPITLQRIDSTLPIDPNKETWIVIHGRMESFEHSASNIMWTLAQTVDVSSGAAQVLTLDWSSGADPFGLNDFANTDFHGETYIQPIAQWLAGILTSNGFADSNINIVGHSWGGVMAAEIAAATNGVNTIIALDPAEDATPGFEGGTSYDTDNIHFNAHSSDSWAFYSRDGGPLGNLFNAGNEETPTTAREAFVVTQSSHSGVVSLFTNMLGDPSGAVSQYFQLPRLLGHLAGPWTLNAYDF